MSHTKGPWRLSGTHTIFADDGDGRPVLIATVSQNNRAAWDANADLIAAAPDLLAACERFVAECESAGAETLSHCQAMTAAIKKAKGETS